MAEKEITTEILDNDNEAVEQENEFDAEEAVSEAESNGENKKTNPVEDDFVDDFDIDDSDESEDETEEDEEDEPRTSFKQSINDKIGDWFILKKSFWKKVGIASSVIVGTVGIVYLAGVAYYSNHFFYGTHIGNFRCSNMTVQEANAHLTKRIKEHKFTIYSKDGSSETITADEIQLQLVDVGNVSDYKKTQNPFMWPFLKQPEKNIPGDIKITINEELLYNRVNSLQCVSESIASLPGATSLIYYDEAERKYKISDDGTRNIVSLSMMQEKVKGGILGLNPDMTLEKDGCYVGLAGDDTIAAYLNTLNTYVSTNIDYLRGPEHTLLDGGTIHTWLITAEDYTVSLNHDAIKQFVAELSALYDTRGGTRTIISSATGENVTVKGGDYGWKVDQEAEFKQLCDELPTGQLISREPVYDHVGGNHGPYHDLPGTYVEVSITHQKLWLYKNYELVLTSNVVTGNPYMNNATHTGTYSLKYKTRDTVLVGDDYRSPVHFWMPFNGGEGLHDAPWRGAFGGNIYRGGGSHGCVNLPYQTAKTIYETIQAGTPIVVY